MYRFEFFFVMFQSLFIERRERKLYKKKGEIKGSVDHILTAKNIKLGINGFGFQMRV
jgi:hypothetical protein